MESSNKDIWDVAVIGGGPAGLMAAGRAAELGARVILLEKNLAPGKKLLITGGGRCNVTNAEFDVKKLLAKYGDASKFLASPFSQWDSKATIEFFETRGMPIKVAAEQRAFPASDTARSVYETLLTYVNGKGVTMVPNAPVASLSAEGGTVAAAKIMGGNTIRARAFILATGGISRPETGSNGDGFRILRTLGHTVDESGGALVPLALVEPIARAAGVAVRAKVTVLQDSAKQTSQIGKMLFTHIGLSGPAILNLSRDIGQLLIHGQVFLEIDFFPAEGYEKIDALLQETLKAHTNKMARNALGAVIAPALVPVLLDRAGINPEKMCNSVTRDERVRLMKTLKHFEVEVKNLLGLEKAVVTSGGVALTEIDMKTMQSLKYPNLYIVGDLLDINRPSGGYSLQICWTTGFVAGSAAAATRA
jgi:predicted Rossmann fold flavoprotein